MKRSRSAERQPTVAGQHRARRTWALGVVASIAILAMLFWIGGRWRRAQAASRIPSPPTLERSPAVAEHLRDRYVAAQRNPSSIDAIGPLCLAYHADMFYDLAEQCYAVASDVARGDWRWAYYRALIQSERGGGEALVVNLRQVTKQSPDFAPAWLRLGDAEFKAGRYDAAAEIWQRAGKLSEPAATSGSPPHVTEAPLSAYASFGLARVAMVRGESDRAREILEEVTASVPQFGPAFRLLADSYRSLERHADAARALYRARRLPPYAPYGDPMVDELARESRNSILLLRLASDANLSMNAAWSEFLTRRALEFDPNNPDVVVKLARVLRTVGRNDEALVLFQRYHEMVPGDFQGLAHLGSCLSALGRYAEAESYFRRALAGLDDPVTHYNVGLLMAITGRLDEAVKEYQKALDRDPMHSEARSNLAAALVRQGNIDRATRELTRLVELDPENAIGHTNLGLVLLQQGRAEQARRHLEEAIRLNPDISRAVEALRSLEG